MKPDLLKRWKKYLPYLDLWIDLGLLQVSTDLMYENKMNDTFEYLFVRVTVLHKWGFSFRLYTRRRG